MTTLRDLVKVHIRNASNATVRFNYHRYHLGSRIMHCRNELGRPCRVRYEFAGDINYDKAARRSMGRSRRVLQRLGHICHSQLDLTGDWVKQADGMMVHTWTEHGMRHRPRKAGK